MNAIHDMGGMHGFGPTYSLQNQGRLPLGLISVIVNAEVV